MRVRLLRRVWCVTPSLVPLGLLVPLVLTATVRAEIPRSRPNPLRAVRWSWRLEPAPRPPAPRRNWCSWPRSRLNGPVYSSDFKADIGPARRDSPRDSTPSC
jgi:hypothetical protein